MLRNRFGGNLAENLKRFDTQPKTGEELRVRTVRGGAVSIITATIILVLILSEFSLFFETEVVSDTKVEFITSGRMSIDFDIVFPKAPCAVLAVDYMDERGIETRDIHHHIYKRRIDSNGDEITVEKQSALGHSGNKQLQNVYDEKSKKECGSCYGAEEREGMCCNTCGEVREAYRKKGWAFAGVRNVSQCIQEGFLENIQAQKNEGCHIYGTITAHRAPGNIHIAPGTSFTQHGNHVHDLAMYAGMKFNMEHHINKLSFGPLVHDMHNPLEGETRAPPHGGNGMVQYYLKLVPTRYNHAVFGSTETHQYSATENFQPNMRGDVVPGVFFFFDFTPIMVEYTEVRRSILHFLTQVCAIIGGVYTVSTLVDTVLERAPMLFGHPQSILRK